MAYLDGLKNSQKIIPYGVDIEEFTPDDLMEIATPPVFDQEPFHHRITITKRKKHLP